MQSSTEKLHVTIKIHNSWLRYYQHDNISNIAMKVKCFMPFITKCTCRLGTLSWSRCRKM